MISTLSLLLAALLAGCSPAGSALQGEGLHPRAKNVLVIYNANAPEALGIAKTYGEKRGVPESNLVAVRVPTEDQIPQQVYERNIRDVIRDVIAKRKLHIDFLLLIRGIPIRFAESPGYSLDAALMVDSHPSRANSHLQPVPQSGFTEADLKRIANPYFGATEPFHSDKYGMYLCTRLDGYTVEDTLGLLVNALRAKPQRGLFLFDAAPDKSQGGYAEMNSRLVAAAAKLKEKGFEAELNTGKEFVAGRTNLMGYASWGSNDGAFAQSAYHSLAFLPGAIAETFVSTSGRTFRPTNGGQSLIADLIRQGVTGVKGYVSEPYTLALARVDILFDRYTSGLNLAESFYAASPMLKWKDVVIGDPLCSPYQKRSEAGKQGL